MDNNVEIYVKEFLENWFNEKKNVPDWVYVAIELSELDVKLYE